MSDQLATLALCWRIERRDGVTIALTAHDRDLTIDGDRYRAAPGMTPSAIMLGEGLDADTMEAKGALDSAAITARDLSAGRWDGARVTMLAIDWSEPGATPIALGGGVIGAVETTEHGFSAELRGPAAQLDRPVAEATSPGCRALLGDRRCRVAMPGRRQVARVVAASGRTLTLDRAEPAVDGWGGGLVRWLGGDNAGLEAAVVASSGAVVTLAGAPRFAVVAGTLVEVTEGCDRTISTCATRFGNAANFRGEPYLPGIDLLTRYPGA